jgi:hypothetical protein
MSLRIRRAELILIIILKSKYEGLNLGASDSAHHSGDVRRKYRSRGAVLDGGLRQLANDAD